MSTAVVPRAGGFGMPLARARVLSPFGPRGRRFHTGVDLIQTRGGGDPVFAAAAGRVIEAGRRRRYGRTVLLEHPDGFRTRYAHLRKLRVWAGDRVETGQELGLVGRTGRATTEHLHFEIITPAGGFVDPARYLFPAAGRPAAGSKK